MLTLFVRRVLPVLLLGSLTLSSCVTYRRGPGPPPPPRGYYRHGHGRPYGPPPPGPGPRY